MGALISVQGQAHVPHALCPAPDLCPLQGLSGQRLQQQAHGGFWFGRYAAGEEVSPPETLPPETP
jgi:hypothetical protein